VVLPKPICLGGDLEVAMEVINNPSSPIRNTWNKGPTKLAVLQAIASCGARLNNGDIFRADIRFALTQKPETVCFLHSYSLALEGVHS